MGVAGSPHAPMGGGTVVKLKTTSRLMGWGVMSWSTTLAAKTVTVHRSPCAKSTAGSRVKVGPEPPLALAVCVPLDVQAMLNQLPLTDTSSLKVTTMLASRATFAAPFAGETLVTRAGMSTPGQAFAVPGVIVRMLRSELFTSLSAPSGQRERPISATVLLSAADVPVPSVNGATVLPS